jgi:glycine cleavage system H protein
VKPEELLYAKTHEWVHVDMGRTGEKIATVGVSGFALEALTDLVFLQLAEIGERVQAGGRFGEVESVKAVSDLYSPVGGEIVEVNAAAANDLTRLAEDPYGFGWLVKIRIDDESSLANLMSYAAYQKQIAEETKEE